MEKIRQIVPSDSTPVRVRDLSSDVLGQRYLSRSVSKALHILERMESLGTAMSIVEVANAAGLTRSSTFRLLHTLEHLRYLQLLPDGRYSYRKGVPLKNAEMTAERLTQICGDTVSKLQGEFHETVSVAALFSNHVRVVCVVESSHVVRMANVVGRIVSPHASSLGKAVAANQTKDVQSLLLNSYGTMSFTPKTKTDRNSILLEYDQIRNQGFSMEDEESTADGFCLGAPIRDKTKHAIGAVSISMPKFRSPEAAMQRKMIAALKRACHSLQILLAENE